MRIKYFLSVFIFTVFALNQSIDARQYNQIKDDDYPDAGFKKREYQVKAAIGLSLEDLEEDETLDIKLVYNGQIHYEVLHSYFNGDALIQVTSLPELIYFEDDEDVNFLHSEDDEIDDLEFKFKFRVSPEGRIKQIYFDYSKLFSDFIDDLQIEKFAPLIQNLNIAQDAAEIQLGHTLENKIVDLFGIHFTRDTSTHFHPHNADYWLLTEEGNWSINPETRLLSFGGTTLFFEEIEGVDNLAVLINREDGWPGMGCLDASFNGRLFFADPEENESGAVDVAAAIKIEFSLLKKE